MLAFINDRPFFFASRHAFAKVAGVFYRKFDQSCTPLVRGPLCLSWVSQLLSIDALCCEDLLHDFRSLSSNGK